MSTNHNQHDDAVDKILAAMRDAAPPEGMETRIAQRLQQHATSPSAAPFRWQYVFANSARTSEWWRGAITGAIAMFLIVGAVLATSHLLQTHPDRMSIATNNPTDHNIAPRSTPGKSVVASTTPVADFLHGAPASQDDAQPCPHPTLRRTSPVVPVHATDLPRSDTRLESDVPSHPAPPLPLTNQERALVRLVQTVRPKQLETLDPIEYANLEAQSALKFERFFAPPAPVSAADGNAATTETNSEGDPKPDSDKQDGVSTEKPEMH